MSYQQVEVNYVGRHFDDNDSAIAFLLQHQHISQALINTWQADLDDGESLVHLLDTSTLGVANFPELLAVDTVSGDGGMILGYVVDSNFVSQADFNNHVQNAQNQWIALFNENVPVEQITRYV